MGRHPIDSDTRVQFLLLKEINRLLLRARIRYWLRGGWAVDLLLGRITRSHADVDLVTWRRHKGRIVRILTTHGYRLEPSRMPKTQLNFYKQGQDVGVLLIYRRLGGRIGTSGFDDSRWPAHVLEFPVRRLNSLTCRVIAPEGLLTDLRKVARRRGNRLRPKDARTVRQLRWVLKAGKLGAVDGTVQLPLTRKNIYW